MKLTKEARIKLLELDKPGYIFTENFLILEMFFSMTTAIFTLYVFGIVLTEHGFKQTIITQSYGIMMFIALVIHTIRQLKYKLQKEAILEDEQNWEKKK